MVSVMHYEVNNPFVGTENYRCFGCAPHHPNGLRLRFERDGQQVRARWRPSAEYQGYSAIVHGGIQATLLDEVSSWAIFVLCGVAAVTRRISVEYERALPINAPEVVVVASVADRSARVITVDAQLRIDDTRYARASVGFRVLPKRLAERDFGFPDPQRFHDKRQGQ